MILQIPDKPFRRKFPFQPRIAEKELREIAVVAVNLGLKAGNVHIVFNNNRSNYAPKSAEQLQRMIEIYHQIKNVRPKVQQPELV